jgi:hypothetical protein
LKILKIFEGIIIGLSARSINSTGIVYVQLKMGGEQLYLVKKILKGLIKFQIVLYIFPLNIKNEIGSKLLRIFLRKILYLMEDIFIKQKMKLIYMCKYLKLKIKKYEKEQKFKSY